MAHDNGPVAPFMAIRVVAGGGSRAAFMARMWLNFEAQYHNKGRKVAALIEAQYLKVLRSLGYPSQLRTLLRLSARSGLQGLVRSAHTSIRHSRSPWVRPPAVWGGVTTPWKKRGPCAESFGPQEETSSWPAG